MAILNNVGEKTSIAVGSLLMTGGLLVNYVFERHNIFVIWENSVYPVAWADLLYPPVCVFMSLTGLILIAGRAISHAPIMQLWKRTLAIAVLMTILYGVFTFAMQFVQTGADRLGECPQLKQAAADSGVIPESQWRPGHLALTCAVERRGVFLSYYNNISVEGVTENSAQQKVLDRIAEHSLHGHTHPVRVMFYDRGNWNVRQGEHGAVGSGTPGKLIRVENIG